MSSVQIAMIAGLPYTALRDAILAHPTLVEGLIRCSRPRIRCRYLEMHEPLTVFSTKSFNKGAKYELSHQNAD
jgi:hypothetical protein